MQPPSGGCVLKHENRLLLAFIPPAAAFGRLCVETGERKIPTGVWFGSRLRAAVC